MHSNPSAGVARIYAACLASYNNGVLHGAWIDCEGKSGDDLRQAIDAMLKGSPFPNVMRRQCEACEHIQGDGHNGDQCGECGGKLSAPFPSAEEWAIHDHEGFAGLIKSEWPDLDELAAAAEILAGDDDDQRRGLLWLVNDRGCSITEAIDQCGDVRTYQADALDLAADYAQELAADVIEDFHDRSSQWPFNCIDWASAGKELEMGGDIDLTEQDGERFVVTNASEF